MLFPTLFVYGAFFAALAVATYLVRSKRWYMCLLALLSSSVALFTYRMMDVSCEDIVNASGCTGNGISVVALVWVALIFFAFMMVGYDLRERRDRKRQKKGEDDGQYVEW